MSATVEVFWNQEPQELSERQFLAQLKADLIGRDISAAVLYTLSMLARYQPAEWSTCIDIDRSEHANAVEHLLLQARTRVPELVLAVLKSVRHSDLPQPPRQN